jgi:hypothetical protein
MVPANAPGQRSGGDVMANDLKTPIFSTTKAITGTAAL